MSERGIAAEVGGVEFQRRFSGLLLSLQILDLGLVDRKLGRRFSLARASLLNFQTKRRGIDGEERGATLDQLIIDDVHCRDRAGYFRGNGNKVRGHIGIVGVGEHITGRPPRCQRQAENRQRT